MISILVAWFAYVIGIAAVHTVGDCLVGKGSAYILIVKVGDGRIARDSNNTTPKTNAEHKITT